MFIGRNLRIESPRARIEAADHQNRYHATTLKTKSMEDIRVH